jgi:hypothetical protein
MKKLLIIAVLAIVTFSSCKKEEETFCYECTTSAVYLFYNGMTDVDYVSTHTECGVKESEYSSLEYERFIMSDHTGELYEVRTCRKQ